MPSAAADQAGPIEKMLLCVECAPWHALYRIAIGWLMLPGFHRLFGRETHGYELILFFGAILLLLRIGPMVLRKVFPFSGAVKAAWFERRNLSKLYDSYQWRKLFWIGLGLAGYCAYVRDFRPANLILAATCVVGGAIGIWRWRCVAPRPAATKT